MNTYRNLTQADIEFIIKQELNLQEKEDKEYEQKRNEFVVNRIDKGARINTDN